MSGDDLVALLAATCRVSEDAIREARRRGLLGFCKHRGVPCWRFGDAHNASLRPLDGHSLSICGDSVKAEPTTRGDDWHRLIGLSDVVNGERDDVILLPEGSKDALAAFHFGDVEGTLEKVGIVCGLGSAMKLRTDDLEKLRGRRVRIISDADDAGRTWVEREAPRLAVVAAEVQVLDLSGLVKTNGDAVKDCADLLSISVDDFERERDLWNITKLDSRGPRIRAVPVQAELCLPVTLTVSAYSANRTQDHWCDDRGAAGREDGATLGRTQDAQDTQESQETDEGGGGEKGESCEVEGDSASFALVLQDLGRGCACYQRDTAREKRWKLWGDLKAIEKRLNRKLDIRECLIAFEAWHTVSGQFLDPAKTKEDYLARFLGERRKRRVATGEGDTLANALLRIEMLPLPQIPKLPNAPLTWRRVAALHREMARATGGDYFLGCRDAIKAAGLRSADQGRIINDALFACGLTQLKRAGRGVPGGEASTWKYLGQIPPLPSTGEH